MSILEILEDCLSRADGIIDVDVFPDRVVVILESGEAVELTPKPLLTGVVRDR